VVPEHRKGVVVGGEGAQRRVLFVEDEAGLRRAYERFLHGRFELAFAETGAAARSEMARFAPDLVVLDLKLPDADGMDVLRDLRAVRPDLRVIITTSYASQQPVFEMLGIPLQGYLVKPFSLSELETKIRDAL
jgi:DNA-binding response OmpR family regulator